MSGRASRVAATLATAALLAGAAGTVGASASSVDHRTGATQVPERAWMRALRIRSEALNRIYVLAPMHALEIRGEALNRINGLDDGERFQAGGS
jgi:hypothetical protein